MSLYDRLYGRPGKGVDENEPEKKGFFLYFDILIHKISKFLLINVLYTLLSLVWIVLLAFLGGLIMNATHLIDNITGVLMSLEPGADAEALKAGTAVLLRTLFGVGIFVLWGSGPVSAAYAYLIRCFVHRLPVFVISDGVDKVKENLKQGIFVLLVDLIFLVVVFNAMGFYYNCYLNSNSVLWLVMTYVMIIAMIIYTMMHPYIYQIMITFKLGLGSIYKNALFLTLAKLPGNFLMLILNIAVLIVPFLVLTPLVAALVTVIFGLCVSRYPSEFYATRVIDRLMLENKE